MNLFGWNLELRRAPRAPRITDGRLRCDACKGAIRKHEHFTVLAVRHKDCKDPKQVGQRSLAMFQEPAPQPRILGGDDVLMPSRAVMAAKMIGAPHE